MRSDMGLSELMGERGVRDRCRRVGGGHGTGGGTHYCGRLLRGCRFGSMLLTASESTITETTGKNKIIHRIFMEEPLFLLWDEIIPQAIVCVIRLNIRYAAGVAAVPSKFYGLTWSSFTGHAAPSFV